VAALIAECALALERSGAWFGHGTANAADEAAALVFFVMGLDHGEAGQAYGLPVKAEDRARVHELLEQRISTRSPLPYLTGEAWFAGLPFHVDPRVLIPRSPFAELIQARFEPWLDAGRIRHILEIGTGSGCLAVASARAFPAAQVTATDIDPQALEVARVNIRRHGLEQRIRLVESDVFEGVAGTFDLILTNPPYVPAGDIDGFPAEYAHEPRRALASGADGMETPARILHHAHRFLADDGWLAIEVGGGAATLEARFPKVPFIWPELEHGGDGIALVSAAELKANACPAIP
jgi:ribosomal protein L3 glutamine methyltransferase